jgi:hypothetical protein
MSNLTESVVTIATAIVGVALLALIVSRKSNTAGVIQAAGSAFSNALGVATSPVTGANVGLQLGYPSSMSGFPSL